MEDPVHSYVSLPCAFRSQARANTVVPCHRYICRLLSVLFSKVSQADTQDVSQNTKNAKGHIKLEKDKACALKANGAPKTNKQNRSGFEPALAFPYYMSLGNYFISLSLDAFPGK